MSAAVSPAPRPNPLRGYAKLIDWRLVAAVGLPLWAFLIGVAASWKPTPAAALGSPDPTALTSPNGLPAPPESPDAIPAPREVVVRTEIVTVPVAVPVATSDESVADKPDEFALPASEVAPGDRCQTYDTKIRFHPGLPDAAEEAKQSKKMILVLHISGNFDDPGFT